MLKNTLLALLSFVSVSAQAYDVSATNCEIFVDKIQVTQGSHSLTKMNVLLKVRADRLDGDVVKVGVFHSRNENRSDRSPDNFDFRTDDVDSFLGSEDYFQFSSTIGSDWMSARERASFFVDTSRGTRYWLNRSNMVGSNFVFDSAVANSFARTPDGYYRSDRVNAYAWDVESIQQTATYPDDLASIFNPKRCR